MKFAVVSMATDAMRELRDISFPNKEAYCRRHGYKWIGETKTRDASRPPAWSKILILADLCVSRSVDWAFWTDADSMIVRPDWKMETLADDSADLIVARDINGINTGVFLMRMGGMTLNFLLDSYALTQYTYHRWWDQAAIRHTLDTGWPFRVKYADKKLINAYPDDFCAGQSAVIHVPNTPRWPDRAGELRRRLPAEAPVTTTELKLPNFASR